MIDCQELALTGSAALGTILAELAVSIKSFASLRLSRWQKECQSHLESLTSQKGLRMFGLEVSLASRIRISKSYLRGTKGCKRDQLVKHLVDLRPHS
jgi:hypothetical protein